MDSNTCADQQPEDRTIPQIDPPEGFQPICEPSCSSSNQSCPNAQNVAGPHNNSNHNQQVDNQMCPGDTGTNRSRSSQDTNSSSARSHNNHLININITINNVGHVENNYDDGESTQVQTVVITNGQQNGLDKNFQPTPSTSSAERLMRGFQSIKSSISRAFANRSLSIINTERCAQDNVPEFAFSNKRALEKTWKLMNQVVRNCQREGMNLNNSPPFILEILPETYQHLKQIYTNYDRSQNRQPPTNDDEYSVIFLRNLQNRCKQTLKLFKEAKEQMFDDKSDYRTKLTRNTLVFNHILSELKAIFPADLFVGDKYLITKKETAGEFWKKSFGTSVLVTWKTFYHALQQVHSIDSSFFSLNALKQTIDLTCDDYISIFEFDVFTRLFQPWATLLKNWQILAVTHPGYKAFLTYDELKARLERYIDKPGSYVFRLSCTRLGQWAIGYVTPDRQILQTIVQNISLSQALTETRFYLYPDGKDGDPSLSALFSDMAGDDRNVTVTEEQYEIYCGVGNSFQTCKICFENDKDIRVEPCNHLLCTSCLVAWQEYEGQNCPFCRTEIKETVRVTMDYKFINRDNNNYTTNDTESAGGDMNSTDQATNK